MTSESLLLAEMMCARLCHDLAGPVGAAAAGAELVGDGGADEETLALVATSAAGAVARLKFFRAAFGPAANVQRSLIIRDLIHAYFQTSTSAASTGWHLDWRGDHSELSAGMARLILNLALLARDSLPRGGNVAISMTTHPQDLRIIASGISAALTEEAASVLESKSGPSGPRGAQAYFTRTLAESLGCSLLVETQESTLTLTVGCT